MWLKRYSPAGNAVYVLPVLKLFVHSTPMVINLAKNIPDCAVVTAVICGPGARDRGQWGDGRDYCQFVTPMTRQGGSAITASMIVNYNIYSIFRPLELAFIHGTNGTLPGIYLRPGHTLRFIEKINRKGAESVMKVIKEMLSCSEGQQQYVIHISGSACYMSTFVNLLIN